MLFGLRATTTACYSFLLYARAGGVKYSSVDSSRLCEVMGAGGSVAQELTSPRLHAKGRGSVLSAHSSTTGTHYREMLEYLRNRFTEEIEVLKSKYGEVDQDALIVKLLIEEFSFSTVEVDDLPALKQQPRDKDKVYVLGDTHFEQRSPSAGVELTSLNPKALEIVGDEKLSAVAREALPANTKTSKKAVELMGSTKVVTEKKALKRLGSEMTDSMRVLQLKTERKQQKEEGNRRVNNASAAEGGKGEGGAADVPRALASPHSFTASPMARRATRLLTEVPKFISDIGMGGGGSKADLSK